MSSSRTASSSAAIHSVHALAILSKWASHYTERRRIESNREITTPAYLIERTHARQVITREKAFRRRLPFSWMRFFAGLTSLMLVFSDIIRGGMGVSSMQATYPALQPDEVLGFGTSWNYTVFSATKTEAAELNSLVWTYKFDSTSISWRAFASYLGVKAFPDCVLYLSSCPETTVCGSVIFSMIDALVDAVANVSTSRRISKTGPVGLTLRTENEYIDRLHQFLLPKWFTNIQWRMNHALHYPSDYVSTINAAGICFPPIGSHVQNPRFCRNLWPNFDRSCAPTDSQCRAVGLLYVDTMRRVQQVQARFLNLTVDLTFLESQEDMQVCRGGLSSLGFRRSDVSAIIRARDCNGSANSCETVYVDDYRYETGLLISDVEQWFSLVAALRVAGQGYFWLRGIGLMLSCYFLFDFPRLDSKLPFWMRFRKARRLFMKVPTQCVGYGSPFPIVCYVLAHLLDAPFTYQVLESHFFSQAGVVDINLETFISYAVVQMRSVWVYALLWRILVRARGVERGKRLNSGIVGVPEMILSVFSSVTLLAQYRMTSIRSAKVLAIMAFPGNVSSAWEAVKYQYSFGHRGRGNRLLGGVIIDLKFLICLLFLVASTYAVHVLWLYYKARRNLQNKYQYSHWVLLPPTPVPYTAGVLWPTSSVCVQWTEDFYCIRDEYRQGPELLEIVEKKYRQHLHPFKERFMRWKHGATRVAASNVDIQTKYPPDTEMRLQTRASRKSADVYRFIQHQMECLHSRSDDVQANIAFMNAVLLSDPLVFFHVMFSGDRSTELGYYQSIWRPRQILLLPVVMFRDENEYTRGLKLIRRAQAAELSWSQLVQCG